MKGYIGTYASTQPNGIYEFDYDEDMYKFLDVKLSFKDTDAKYLSCYKGILAYPYKEGIKMIRDEQVYQADPQPHVPCYIVQDEQYIYTANYHDGTLMRYRKSETGMVLDSTVLIKEGAGAHQVILHDQVIFVPCRMLDRIDVFDRKTLSLITQIKMPKDSGPRHGVLSKNQEVLYLVSENSCVLFQINTKTYQIERELPLLQVGEIGGAAAIRMSEDERFLYISVRDINQIYVIDREGWKVIQVLSSFGDHPRDIALSPSGRTLFVANRTSNTLIAYQRNEASGQLNKVDELPNIIEGVSIAFGKEPYA